MKSPIAYYRDEFHTKRMAVNEIGHPIIDWGETIPGKKKEIKLYIQNESKDSLVIRQPYSTNKDLKIEDYPSRLFSEEKGTMTFSLTPNTEKIETHHGTWGFELVLV